MSEEKLNLSVFENATISFKKAIDQYQRYKDKEDGEYYRDSCIKRFEYCYDSSKKILIRHLKNIGEDEIDNMSLENIIRLGAKKRILLHSWDIWDNYRSNRNQTSHGYDEHIAIEIADKIPSFLVELEYFLTKLKDYYEV